MFALILTVLAFLNGYAQPKFYTQISEPKIYLGQSFQVRYIVEGSSEIGLFRLPDYEGFQVTNIYEVPSSQKIDPVSQQPISVYSKVVVLTPIESGSFIIRGAIAQIGGKTLRANNVRISVWPDSRGTNDGGVEDASELREGESIDQKLQDNFFLLAEVSKRTCFVGEPIYAVIKACSRLNATSQVTRRPSFTGFSVIEMVDNYDQPPTVEKIDGVNFFVHIIRKVQLLPLQPGKFVIDHAEVESTVQFVTPNPEMDFEEVIRGKPDLKTISRDVTLRSPSIPIEVKPLPDTGQPANFSGAVGAFSVMASVSDRTIEEGSTGTLKVIIKGRGNLPLITAPDIPSTDKFSISAAGVKENLDPYQHPVGGYKEFEYEVTPKVHGNLQIPAISFAYFDPSQKKYITEQAGPFYFNVVDPKGNAGGAFVEGKNSGGIPPQLFAFGLIALLIIGWIVYQFLSGQKQKQTASLPATPPIIEVNKFASVDAAIAEQRPTTFLQELQKLIYIELDTKYDLALKHHSRYELSNAMKMKECDAAQIQKADALLAECEWNLYAAGAEVEFERLRNEAAELLNFDK